MVPPHRFSMLVLVLVLESALGNRALCRLDRDAAGWLDRGMSDRYRTRLLRGRGRAGCKELSCTRQVARISVPAPPQLVNERTIEVEELIRERGMFSSDGP